MTNPKKRTTKPRTSKAKSTAPDPWDTETQDATGSTPTDRQPTTTSEPTIGTTPTPTGMSEESEIAGNPTTTDAAIGTEIAGNVLDPGTLDGGIHEEESVESRLASRATRLPGEGRSGCHERLRRLARAAGMPRGQGPGTAYNWALEQTNILFAKLAEDSAPPPAPVPEPAVVDEEPEQTSTIVDKSDTPPVEVAASTIVDKSEGVAGLGEIPESWPKLPANAPLSVEIAWVSANRLLVRSGKGVDLSRSLSPAPSYSALSWLETAILFPSKFADTLVKAPAQDEDEKEFVRREKLAIEEIRSILKEMLDAKTTQ